MKKKQSEEYKTNAKICSESKQADIPEDNWIYMDGLSYVNKFFDSNGNHWKVPEALEKVKKFVDTVTRSGYKIKVFIDAATISGKAKATWLERREAEVMHETRSIPQATDTLLGDAFRQNGVEVLYSLEADNHDTLAAYAHRDKAAILSDDCDFSCYRDLNCPIHRKFNLSSGWLELTELLPITKKTDKSLKKCNVIVPPPETMSKDPGMLGVYTKVYRGGSPTPLTKLLGNPHIIISPLRQALYSRKQVLGSVQEIFPAFQEGEVVWLDKNVAPDAKLDDLLDRPEDAFEMFFPKESLVKPEEVANGVWQNHLYALHAIVYEICALGSKDNDISLLQMLLPAINKFRKDNILVTSKPTGPGWEGKCRYCNIAIILTREELTFYEIKGFNMPKQCQKCKKKHLKMPK